MSKIWIGIDPDAEKSGVAVWDSKELTLLNLRFFELYEKLINCNMHCSLNGKELTVVIEAGWLNTKSNWHSYGHGENVAAKIGTKVGANHQTGKLIAEACEYLGIEYQLKKPKR